jgi:hypothetical protein
MSNPFERYAAALEAEGRAESKAAREAAKLEPLTIVISDQEELRRIYAIVSALPYKQQVVPYVRAHLRGWSRDRLNEIRAENKVA